jgi:hypothetical protein
MHLIGTAPKTWFALKVLNNFSRLKDTLGTGIQSGERPNLYGKFEDGKLQDVDIVKNAEVVYFMRNEDKELIGINKKC